jgi:hypothetical protein
MSKTKLITLIITVFVLLLPVFVWADLSATCEQENIFDHGDNCSWPFNQTGTRCCCWCSDPMGAHAFGHVMDLGQFFSNSDVYFEIKPGAGDAGCITTGYMYYSIDGTNWSLFWTKPNLAGWTTYTDTVHITDNFRYIRANTDGCSVDWSKIEINKPIDLSSGLVAYWSFDNCDATDDSGNGHNGTIYGNPQCVDGEKGKAFSFDGVDNDFIEITDTDILKQFPLTIAAWVNPSIRNDEAISYTTPGYPNNVISNDIPAHGGHGFGINVWSSGSEMKVELEDGWRSVPSAVFNSANWYHIVVVYTAGNVTSYVDGNLIDNYSYYQQIPDGGDFVRIGKHNDDVGYGTKRFFKGAIDEVRIYNRALTEAEIQALYVANSFKLPDTGHTKCYDAAGSIISCEGTGQDGEYVHNPLSYADNGDGSVTDNNTGMVWQKEDDGNTYNWYLASGTYDANFNPESTDVCGSLDLGGATDWRLPSKKELMSIVDYAIPYPGPTIATAFSNTKTSNNYWSSTTYAKWPDVAWYVWFANGGDSAGYKGRCSMFDAYVVDRHQALPSPTTTTAW